MQAKLIRTERRKDLKKEWRTGRNKENENNFERGGM